MMSSQITLQVNPFKADAASLPTPFADGASIQQVAAFHRSLPGYAPTPLRALEHLAHRLKVGRILVKDESYRFGLNAFKVLGASYAIAKALAGRLRLKDHDMAYSRILKEKAQFDDMTFVTATDGNHGRAVAWVAHRMGCRAVVLMPRNSSTVRLAAIQAFAHEAFITDVNYDDTVRQAARLADQHGWTLIQDTAWPGYEKIPADIMRGYFSLVSETMDQTGGDLPTHVFLQAGVGSMAAAVLAAFCHYAGSDPPRFVVVEPDGAPCFFRSAESADGRPHAVGGDLDTIMAGLACGEPSPLAWDILKAGAMAFVRCGDDIARRGMRVLGNPLKGDPAIISGESGAVTLGLVYTLMTDDQYTGIRETLGLNADAKIFLLSTEGDTDPEMYRRIVWA